MSHLPFLAILAAAALGACSVDEPVNPRAGSGSDDGGLPVVDGGEDAPYDAAPDAPIEAGPVKRTVLERNPFGDVAATENLLWDGDFEFTSPFSDEYGWLLGPPYAYTGFDVRIGVACRSGIKCVALPKSKTLAAIGVGSSGQKLDASIWAKPATPSCAKITAMLTSLDGSDPDLLVPLESMTPDATGYCHLHVVAAARTAKTYLLLQNKTGKELVVDDAVLLRVPAMKSLTVSFGPLEPGDAAAIEELRADLRRLRGPHDAPPNSARRAFEGAPR